MQNARRTATCGRRFCLLFIFRQHRTIPALRQAPLRQLRHGICVAKMLDKTSSIICAFGLASAAPRSPYRHLELCGIAFIIRAYYLPLKWRRFLLYTWLRYRCPAHTHSRQSLHYQRFRVSLVIQVNKCAPRHHGCAGICRISITVHKPAVCRGNIHQAAIGNHIGVDRHRTIGQPPPRRWDFKRT